jgi:hypothetical protein
MSRPERSLPTLFGRYSLVLSEHANLDLTFGRLKALVRCSRLVPHRRSSLLSALMTDLRSNLERHFQAEESGEYFGALVGENPALAPRVTVLRHQHRAMLATLDGLRLLAFEPHAWRQLQEALDALANAFQTHERSESLLIQSFLADDWTAAS